ncbi:MAG: hypothetical protein NTX91_01445 [candidate division SR1 bacterium]|nr:hypothetical protein [candidate division SR1 bacterium]
MNHSEYLLQDHGFDDVQFLQESNYFTDACYRQNTYLVCKNGERKAVRLSNTTADGKKQICDVISETFTTPGEVKNAVDKHIQTLRRNFSERLKMVDEVPDCSERFRMYS